MDIYHATVNGKTTHRIDWDAQTINDVAFEWDILKDGSRKLHIIRDFRSYNVEVAEADFIAKTFSIKVNGNTYHVELKDKFDGLLKDLGLDNLASQKVNEIKAPMPGLVVDVRVQAGDLLKKGDAVLVLEAMKMENILKAPSDGLVKKVNVVKGAKVEKNQVLLHLE